METEIVILMIMIQDMIIYRDQIEKIIEMIEVIHISKEQVQEEINIEEEKMKTPMLKEMKEEITEIEKMLIKGKMAMRNRFSILLILKTDYTSYALPFFPL